MPDETLLTAARRVVRFTNIDEAKGGLTSTETLRALETLNKQVTIATAVEKAAIAYARDLEDSGDPKLKESAQFILALTGGANYD